MSRLLLEWKAGPARTCDRLVRARVIAEYSTRRKRLDHSRLLGSQLRDVRIPRIFNQVELDRAPTRVVVHCRQTCETFGADQLNQVRPEPRARIQRSWSVLLQLFRSDVPARCVAW